MKNSGNFVIKSDVTSRGKSHVVISSLRSSVNLPLGGLKLPVKMKSKQPDKLGSDRLALACGAAHLFKAKDVLVISAGTCITYEMIDAGGDYAGGAIAPGLLMRLKAMAHFTAKLPLITKIPDEIPLTGQDTVECMLSGAINGAVAEIAYTIDLYNNIYPGVNVILTGGDAAYLQARLKSKIFVPLEQTLTLIGLNTILQLNAKNFSGA